MADLTALSAIPDAELSIGTIVARDGNRYLVSIAGVTHNCKSTLSENLAPGRKVMVSNLQGRRYITDGLAGYANAARKELIINV